MRTIKRLFIVLSFLSFSGLTHSQSIFGLWENSQMNIKMTLNADGTYLFVGPYGQSAGIYGIQGNVFSMQDQTGQLIQYTIHYFDASHLNLLDINGVPLNYTRNSVPQPTGDILAQSQGQTLTTGHIQIGVGIAQFIIGHPIKSTEIDELTAASIQEFNSAPQLFLNEVNNLGQSLQTLRQLQDPIQIGTVRQMLVAEFYKATRSLTEMEKPLLIQVINRYIRVLAFDEANTLALTDTDADAMIAYMEFTQKMAGVDHTFSSDERQQFYSDLIDQFTAMPLEQKQFLCSASLAWTLVQTNWNQFSSVQQKQFQQSFVDNQAVQYQASGNTIQSDSPLSKQEQIQKMARENRARQNMFQMMNNMSLQNHATMLNTIENFGGTGNYWEVTDLGY